METTLDELSGLLKRTTGVKARDVLRGLVDMDQFERDIRQLSRRVSASGGTEGTEGCEDEGSGVDDEEYDGSENEYTEDDEEQDSEDEEQNLDSFSGSEGDFDESASDSDSINIDEMDPKQQLEMLMAPVDGDDQDQEEEEYDFEDVESDQDTAADASKKHLSLSSDESDTDALDTVHQRLSSYEQQKRRMAKEIAELERENVSLNDANDNKWTMSGEVRATQRPENSLLEHVVDFEHATKALPEITEAVTESHEQVIRNRIRERAFDDPPLRRIIAEEQGGEGQPPKKTIKLDDTAKADRASLAQVYEKDVLREAGLDADVTGREKRQMAVYAELDRLYARICATMDAMSGVRVIAN